MAIFSFADSFKSLTNTDSRDYAEGMERRPVKLPANPVDVVAFILFWPFMLLRQLAGQLPQAPFQEDEGATYSNEEVWEWTDWRGRERKITVSRHAQRR